MAKKALLIKHIGHARLDLLLLTFATLGYVRSKLETRLDLDERVGTMPFDAEFEPRVVGAHTASRLMGNP